MFKFETCAADEFMKTDDIEGKIVREDSFYIFNQLGHDYACCLLQKRG